MAKFLTSEHLAVLFSLKLSAGIIYICFVSDNSSFLGGVVNGKRIGECNEGCVPCFFIAPLLAVLCLSVCMCKGGKGLGKCTGMT